MGAKVTIIYADGSEGFIAGTVNDLYQLSEIIEKVSKRNRKKAVGHTIVFTSMAWLEKQLFRTTPKIEI